MFVAASLLFIPHLAAAQLTLAESVVVHGSYVVIGNGSIDCPGTTACDNNDSMMAPVDVDTLVLGDLDGDGDDDTTMSSASTLALPTGALVRAAFLDVNGFGSDSVLGNGGPIWTSTVPADFPVLFAGPAGSYVSLLPYKVSQYYDGRGYDARYDATALVSGSGEYFVANARIAPATNPFNRLQSWTLIVLYEDASPPKLVTLYDGTLLCANNSTPIVIGNFLTPSTGAISALFTIVGNDGFAPGPNTESIQVGSLLVSNGQNPSNAIGNGTVSGPNGPIARNPSSFLVSEPIDIDTFDVSSAFTPAQSAVTVTFSCQSDGVIYTGMVLGMDVLLPAVSATKSATDLNGGETLPGDTVQYSINLLIDSGDNAVDVVLRDPIPAGTSFVPGSIELVTSATVAITDMAGDDQGELDADTVVVRIGDRAIGERANVRFRVTIDTTTAARTIANLGEISLRGAQGGSGNTRSTLYTSPVFGDGPTLIDVLPCAGFSNGSCPDAGVASDAAAASDAEPADNGSNPIDAGTVDAGAPPPDSGAPSDSGVRPDAGSNPIDASVSEMPGDESGCSCRAQHSAGSAWGALAPALLLLLRRRRGKLGLVLAALLLLPCACADPESEDGGPDAAAIDSGRADSGSANDSGTDAGSTDRGSGIDVGSSDSGDGDGSAADSGDTDAGSIQDAEPVTQVGPALEEHSGIIFTDGCPLALAITSTGTPVVAFRRADGNHGLAVARLYQNRWAQLPGLVNTSTIDDGRCWALGLEAGDVPVVAFGQRGLTPGSYEARVSHWTGSAWADMGASAIVSLYDTLLDLIVDGQGRPIFVHTQLSMIHAARYESGGWSPLGAPFVGAMAYDNALSLAMQTNDEPALAWSEGVGGSNAKLLYVATFDGSNWQQIGVVDSVPNATQNISDPRLVIDGELVMTYSKNPGSVFHLRRYNGSTWDEETLPSGLVGSPLVPALLAVGGGGLMMGWDDAQGGPVQVSRLSGSVWSPFFNSPFTSARPGYAVLARRGDWIFLAHHGVSNQGHVLRLQLP